MTTLFFRQTWNPQDNCYSRFFLFTSMCCSQCTFLYHGLDEFRASDLESAMRFVYKEPTAETSGDETIAERGWKFVFPTNQ